MLCCVPGGGVGAIKGPDRGAWSIQRAVFVKNPPDWHEYSSKISMTTPCRYYALGKCRYGDNCRYIHEISDDEVHLREDEEKRSRDAECGICFEQVKSKFGLLRCQCIFCLPCIKEWRSKGHDIAAKSTVRLCPLCRTESFEVIPSDLHVIDPTRKAKLMESYRTTRSHIPCKHFKPEIPWSCRFGKYCVYAHRMADGSSVPEDFYSRPPNRNSPRRRHIPTIDFPDESTSVYELRIFFDTVVENMLDQSLYDEDASEELIECVVLDLFVERYGISRAIEMINLRL